MSWESMGGSEEERAARFQGGNGWAAVIPPGMDKI
jgi:hypothetical protein